MSDYGVTTAGFIRKPYEVILRENEEKARSAFGEDIDLSIYSPVGMFIQVLSWNDDRIWQELEKAYYSNWLDTAEGVNLDRVVAWGGLSRMRAQKAVVRNVVFSGEENTVIPMTFLVETAQGIQFEVMNTGTIDSSGSVELDCRAVLTGPDGNVPPHTITKIYDALAGLVSVDNPEEGEGGCNDETDAELRFRYNQLILSGKGSNVDTIKRAILEVEDVMNVNVYENDEITADAEGRPPKSVECVVWGGDSQAIAETIFRNKPAGIESYAPEPKETCQVEDSDGKSYEIVFKRPEQVNIYVEIDIAENSEWNPDSEADIMTNAIKYIGGVDTRTVEGNPVATEYTGLMPGSVIYPWRIIIANRDITGINKMTVRVKAEGGTFTDEELTLGFRELPRCENTFITINPGV